MPFLTQAQAKNYAATKETLSKLVAILVEVEQYADNPSYLLTLYLHLYNNFGATNGLKADIFLALVRFCERLGRLDIMVNQLHTIDSQCSKWSMTPPEKRHLLREIYLSLDRINDSKAFKICLAYLKEFQNQSKNAQIKENELTTLDTDARRCVILAIKARDVINFEELLELNAIKQLKGANKQVLDLLDLFIEADAKNFESKLSNFTDLMASENLDKQSVILKKSYLQICSLSTESITNFKYDDLAQLLNLDKDDVEEWAIEAIQAKVIDAKIDQLNEEIVIKSHMMRKIGKPEWQAIHAKIGHWKMRFQRMHDVLNVSNQMSAAALPEEAKVAIQ